MKTLNQIGKVALSRVLSSRKFWGDEPHKMESPTIWFMDEPFDLTRKNAQTGNTNEHYGNIQTRTFSGFEVWGIELGLVGLEIKSGQSFLEAIQEIVGTGAKPSHIIKHNGGDSDMGNWSTYEVTRFTNEQDQLIAR
jgi:hypothetical protein